MALRRGSPLHSSLPDLHSAKVRIGLSLQQEREARGRPVAHTPRAGHIESLYPRKRTFLSRHLMSPERRMFAVPRASVPYISNLYQSPAPAVYSVSPACSHHCSYAWPASCCNSRHASPCSRSHRQDELLMLKQQNELEGLKQRNQQLNS